MSGNMLLAPGQNSLGVSPLLSLVTAPLPNTEAGETRYYSCTVKSASIHRPDGKRIAFAPFGIFEATLVADIEYLEAEIKNGHPQITRATGEEVQQFKKYKDPKGSLIAEIGEKMQDDIVKGLLDEISSGNIKPNSTASKIIDQLRLQGVDNAGTGRRPAPSAHSFRARQQYLRSSEPDNHAFRQK